ncbi:Protein argonaute-2 [Orchesella cincta]|uniref:Protein argonaute-2 n=1 Tax=Orchesella cincta TaxID=48709 RepID=A0A1D2NC53_ORCCI|nr:Protein argonaute-2 [Orchesella cincta]
MVFGIQKMETTTFDDCVQLLAVFKLSDSFITLITVVEAVEVAEGEEEVVEEEEVMIIEAVEWSRRGGGGGRGGGRGRGPPPRYDDAGRVPDPYKLEYTPQQKQLHTNGWKKFDFEKKEDVVLQKYNGPPPQWAARKIKVSVNHFLVTSTKGPKSFAIPTLYHYDISFEIMRNRAGAGKADSKPQTSKGKRKRKNSEESVAGSEASVDSVTRQLEDSSLDGGKQKGTKPPAKKLPKYLTNTILAYLIPKLRQDYNHNAIATDGSFNMYSTKLLEAAGIPSQHDVSFVDLKREGFMDEDDNATVKVMFEKSIDKTTGEIHTIDTNAIAKYFQTNATLQGFTFPAEVRQTLEAACNAIVRIANCAFVLDKPVLDVLAELGNFYNTPVEDFDKWNRNDTEEARSFLRTCKISYVVDGKKLGGPIRDVHNKSASKATFRWEEKKKDISVYDYYKERYGMTLKYKNGPVLKIRNTALVPAELCTIKKGQSYNRKLDGRQTTNMLSFAKRDPGDLHDDIISKMKAMQLNNNKALKGFGIQLPDRMLELEAARVLVPPALRYGSKSGTNQVAHMCPEDGTWEIWSHEFNFYKPVSVEEWGVLVVGSQKIRQPNDDALRKFCECLMSNGSQKGVMFKKKPNIIVESRCRRGNHPEDNLKYIKEAMQRNFMHVQLLVVVFPQKGDPLYGHVKHAAEVDVGLLTQCVAERNVLPFCKDATIQNILLKINSKLGGINHVTVAPFDKQRASMFTTLLMDCPILILGADVTHAPPGSKKFVNDKEFIMPSYAAVTGSIDKTCMPFMTEVRAQRKPNAGAAEVIMDLEKIVKKMLLTFRAKSGNVIPQKIIYFRDGVGEGQFPEVLHVEMTAIRRACASLKNTYQPKITFITVQKRHKTRIFYHAPSGRIENAPAGTVIDREIVHASETDFYLLSHKGMMGTSRPSRYHVLWDDSDFSQDVLQSLAYTLCYMYVRCTKSVKMPSCTYYAHLAADRAKKLCEGFESKGGQEPTDEFLNSMLQRNQNFIGKFPMHFV